MNDNTTSNRVIVKETWKGGPEWTLRIQNVTLERFQKRLNSDLPIEYGNTIGRNKLEWDIYELGQDEISIWWQVVNEPATRPDSIGMTAEEFAKRFPTIKENSVDMSVAQYTEDSLTVTIRRWTPLQALMPVRAISRAEWTDLEERRQVASKLKQKTFGQIHLAFGEEGGIFYTPWTEEQELAVMHGRKLVSWLLEWVQEKIYGQVIAIPDEILLKQYEDEELKSPDSFGYYTTEGRRWWEKRQRTKAKADTDNSTAPALASQPANQAEQGPPALPTEPPHPNVNDWTWDDLFDWKYRQEKCLGRKISLRKLAEQIPNEYGTVKNRHSGYTKEHNYQPLPDSKSKFVGK